MIISLGILLPSLILTGSLDGSLRLREVLEGTKMYNNKAIDLHHCNYVNRD